MKCLFVCVKNGCTALMLAVRHQSSGSDSEAVARLLVERGAALGVQDQVCRVSVALGNFCLHI